MYHHRPRHADRRSLWHPSAGVVVLVLTWAALAGLVYGGAS